MLRLLVLVLLLANAGYFAWSQNLLADYGFAPQAQAEPQRLKQQIRPEALQLLALPRDEPAQAQPAVVASSGVPSDAAQCLQAGFFTDEQANALRPGLQASLPEGSWSLEGSVEPGRWIIYMGRYANEEALVKKRNELRRRNVSFEPLLNPALNPGLSLGHFNSQAEANSELDNITQQGVRTARVLQERPEVRGHTLKLAAADAALVTKVNTLKALLAGKALQACR